MPERILVCMSGGVDSTVAAFLLKEQGNYVQGITFWFWSFPGAPDYASQIEDTSVTAASLAAEKLGIEHRVVDASDRFYDLVIRDFVDRYRSGETPNPCGRCNRMLRFGLALEIAIKEGFDRISTGHHARILPCEEDHLCLYRGADSAKDQSYFLYGLREETLSRLAFPVGQMSKEEVQAIATRHGLSSMVQSESQDLCFAQAGKTDFLFTDEDSEPGPILDMQGNHLGEHQGLFRYTIGQRRGLKLVASQPLYVVSIDRRTNTLTVGPEEALYSSGLLAEEASYVSDELPEDDSALSAKLRYRSPSVSAAYKRFSADSFSLHFEKSQRAVTPGQIAALYHGERLLGGGIIRKPLG